MKKITILLSFIFAVFVFHANAQVEGFENATVGSLPTGWTAQQSEADDAGFMVADEVGYAHSGSQYLAHLGDDISTTSTSWVVSSAYALSNNYELKFYWRGKWTSSYNFTGVYVSTTSSDPVANPGDFTLLEELSPANYPNTWLQWSEAAYDLSSYTGQIYIAFKYVGDHAHDFYIDDVGVAPMPYCEPSANVDVVAYTDNTLDVRWDAVLGMDNYEIVWGALGFDPDGAGVTPVAVTGNTYQMTGLTQTTSYDIYVRTICAAYNQSDWAGPTVGVTSGPPPANNDCVDATDLTVYADGAGVGNEVAGDTTNATDSGAHPSCDDTGTNLDVFYTFTLPAGETRVQVITGGAEGAYIEAALYDTCGGIEMDCQGTGASKIFAGLTGGTTYTLQVWHDDYNKGTFDIVLELLPPPPANDLCAGAIDLTVYPENASAGNEVDGDTTSASDSGNHPSCDDYGVNLDLWYTFTVSPGKDGVKVITGGAQGGYIEAALYDACGGAEYDCQGQGNAKMFMGLTAGTTYTLQVWHDEGYKGPFNIAVEDAPSAPRNGDCANAIGLTVYPYGTGAGNELQQSTLAATDSGVHPSCDNSGTNLDLWYTVTVPAGETGFMAKFGGAEGGSLESALYDACGGIELDCNGGGTALHNGLTAGTTYYLQVWHDDFNAGDFDVLIETLPGAPANDLCSGAIPITVYNGIQPTIGNNFATTDSNETTPSCANYSGGDIWYSVVVPTDGNVTIESTRVAGSSVTDTGMAVYSGSCGALTQIECDDDDSSDGLFSMIDLTGQTPGDVLYIRIWEYGNNSFGDIGVCAHNANVSVADNKIDGFKYYPNPVSHTLNLDAQSNIQNISIYNVSGQEVLNLHPDALQTQIDMQQLQQGIYFVKVQIANQITAFKIVKE